jgi:hypothetical protein
LSDDASAITAEALRVLDAAQADDLPVRLMGGLAILMHAPEGVGSELRRVPGDIDLVTERGRGKALSSLMVKLGYEPDRRFNGVNAGRRGLYHDRGVERKVDVFLGSFEMCHQLPIGARLELEDRTLPLAELMLTKLQIVKLNEKDVRDILLLLTHPVGDGDEETINGHYIAQLCAQDWGLWRTCTGTIEQVRADLPQRVSARHERQVMAERLDRLRQFIMDAPKSRGWRLRDRIGERRRWYQDPEEVE